MSTPTTKAPSKKAFHFPKTVETPAAEPTAGKSKSSSKPVAVATKKSPSKAQSAKTEKAAVKAKPAEESVTKPVTKPTTKSAEKAAAPVKAKESKAKTKAVAPVEAVSVEAKVKRPKKEKVIRDSFTMPKSDYEKIDQLKQKCLANGVHVKKGELLRAGLLVLESVTIEQLTAAVAAVETVKTGRPGKA